MSALISRNSGPEDATIRIQFTGKSKKSPKEFARRLRRLLGKEFSDLQFSLHSGLTTAPAIVVRISGPSLEQGYKLAKKVHRQACAVGGTVDVQIAKRMHNPKKGSHITPAQISHVNITRAFHVRINVEGRQVSDVAADVELSLSRLEAPRGFHVALTKPTP